MDVKRVTLTNVGPFKALDIPLASGGPNRGNITIFVGNNGAGKTSILQSLAISLSWFIARLRTEKGIGSSISEDAILNSANSAAVEIEIYDSFTSSVDDHKKEEQHQFQWTLAKARAGRKSQYSSQLNDCSRLADRYRSTLTNNDQTSLPLIAFYPVERSVLDMPLKIRNKHTFLQLDSYDKALIQGVDFRRFFEWFRDREDAENEAKIDETTDNRKAIINRLRQKNNRLRQLLESQKRNLNPNESESESESILQILNETESESESILQGLNEIDALAEDPQLKAIRTAILSFMPHMDNLRVRRKPRLHMAIDKNGETLNVAQLSQGEKSLIALVGDIARRLAMLNPALENPLMGDGIVLIDEVDLHLHPSWQRSLCDRLTATFPNCQFVLTSHSPLVISDCKDVLVYTLTNGELQELPSQYGQDANMVLLDVMDTSIRNEKVQIELNNLLDAIQDSNLVQAHQMLADLTTKLPADNLEIAKASLLLRKQELRHANHS
jgi:predicted ATP-binding protein involved in virulence